ncbi:hypothetical protein AB0D57_06405 [Streptomyces sp. NPDC048275]|uniref:hypothetical protein n=1 Tax=Streptomyces sp. NPDC048275 TaxID=3155629 RepID=UPI0033E876C3
MIALQAYDRGPVVAWDTDPRTQFVAKPHAWHPDFRTSMPPRTAPRLNTSAPTAAPAPRKAARR